jgi:hypothetical protein
MLVRTIKAWWLIAAFGSGFALAMWAEELVLNWRDNHLEFAAPHFLSGKALDRLHNGVDVPFDFRFTLWSGNRTRVLRQIPERFVVSWDIWEEKFKVVKTQAPRSAIAHLDAAAAELWCTRQMQMDTTGLLDTETFSARLEIRAEDSKESGLFGRSINDSGISLTSLVELFSRPPGGSQLHWTVDSPELTLDEIKHRLRRGS